MVTTENTTRRGFERLWQLGAVGIRLENRREDRCAHACWEGRRVRTVDEPLIEKPYKLNIPYTPLETD